jgi:hypothetical protein
MSAVRTQNGRRRLRLIAGWLLVAAAVAGIATVIVAAILADDDRGITYRFATEQYVNEKGGYRFRHPPDWEVERQGTATVLRSPDGDVIVSFGLGAKGGLEPAETRFVREIRGRYRNTDLLALQARQVGPHPALSVSGIGTNERGIRIRFLAITVRIEKKNYSIAVFTPANANPQTVLPPTQEVINSLRAA